MTEEIYLLGLLLRYLGLCKKKGAQAIQGLQWKWGSWKGAKTGRWREGTLGGDINGYTIIWLTLSGSLILGTIGLAPQYVAAQIMLPGASLSFLQHRSQTSYDFVSSTVFNPLYWTNLIYPEAQILVTETLSLIPCQGSFNWKSKWKRLGAGTAGRAFALYSKTPCTIFSSFFPWPTSSSVTASLRGGAKPKGQEDWKDYTSR